LSGVLGTEFPREDIGLGPDATALPRPASIRLQKVDSMVHSETNALEPLILLVHFEANRMVHLEANSALRSKKQCTWKQISVHCEARNGAR
jgi:hypothetical protein